MKHTKKAEAFKKLFIEMKNQIDALLPGVDILKVTVKLIDSGNSIYYK